MLRNDAINIYTDGSAFSKPRVGGMGVRLVLVDSDANEIVEDHVLDGHVGATNNQMELRACARGLQLAYEHPRSREYQRRVVFSDCRYVVDNWRSATDIWPNSGWRTREGAPVLNVDLWKELVGWIVRTGRRVDFVWVKGHAKDQHNKAVDKLARESAKSVIGPLFNPPLSVVHVRRKLTKSSVQRGSVPMLGQRLQVRIITSEFLRTQKVYKYKYEVISDASPYRGLVDVAFSAILLGAGHHYELDLNGDQGAPEFLTLCRELDRTGPGA
jgi:ribonuclease HI